MGSRPGRVLSGRLLFTASIRRVLQDKSLCLRVLCGGIHAGEGKKSEEA